MQKATFMGNAPIDYLQNTTPDKVQEFGLIMGDFQHAPEETLETISQTCGPQTLCPGGAIANTSWTLGKLGQNHNYIGRVGEDEAGKRFYTSMQTAGVTMPTPDASATSMKINVLVTPDGQRTFATSGIPSPLHEDYIPAQYITSSDWLFVEGYLLLDENQHSAVEKAISLARHNGLKIAMTLATPFVMQAAFGPLSREIIAGLDLIIGNDEEFQELVKAVDGYKHEAADLLTQKMSITPRLITHGGDGASFLDAEGHKTFTPCPTINGVVDTTGAGDAFLAGFLEGFFQDKSIETCLNQGHEVAAKVIVQYGGRADMVQPFNPKAA